VSIFVDASHLGLLVAMSGVAAISGLALVQSIKDEDVALACIWGISFVVTSLGAAWTFWGRMMFCPGARKDDALFLPFLPNNCLALQTITKGALSWT
jgi:hypothetical protein